MVVQLRSCYCTTNCCPILIQYWNSFCRFERSTRCKEETILVQGGDGIQIGFQLERSQNETCV
jgi:hypothetical protein